MIQLLVIMMMSLKILYEKYQGSGSMSPELRLMFMVGGSAFMYHISNSMFKSKLPNVDEILNQIQI